MPLAKRRSEQKNVFTTNSQNQKINHLNQTALFLTQGLTTAALQCAVRPLFFFFLTKSQPFNKKPKQNYIKQSQQSIQNLSINNTLKTKHNKQTRKTISSINRKINHKNNHNKQPTSLNQKHTQRQTQQAITTKCNVFLNIKISQTATASEPTTNTLFIKTQYYRKKQNNITYTLR